MFTICLQIVHTLFITDLYNILKDKGKGYLKRVLKVYSMKKYVELNNRTFEVKKVKCKIHPLRLRALSDCYNKPSISKISIYSYWVNWLMKLNDISTDMLFNHMSVISYNANVFTLGCDVYNNENKLIGQLYITKTRQEFWTV